MTLGFARAAAAGHPGRRPAAKPVLARLRNRVFPHAPPRSAPEELAAAIKAEVAAGAAWVKIIGDFPEWAGGRPGA